MELDLGTQSHLGSAAEETEPDGMVWRAEALLPLKKNQHLGFQGLYREENISKIKEIHQEEQTRDLEDKGEDSEEAEMELF